MNKLYNGPTWHNNTNPALNETNLNILGQAVDDIDDRVIAIAGTVMETVPQVQEDLAAAQALEAKLEELTENPPYIGANGNWYVWDANTGHYVDSGVDASITVSVDPNTVTLPAGSNAYVQNTGTSTDPVLKFGIPKGPKGDTGGATAGSDISDTVVDTITASTAEYPEIAAADTMKVITGKIKKFLDDLKTKKADKVTSATNGHLAGLDSNGNLTDSGKSSSAVLPSGGTTGQVLKKSSGTDYAVEWGDASGGVPQSMIGDAWVTSHAYAVGDYCIEGNVLYKCKTAHTSSANYKPPYASYWDAVSVASEFIDYRNQLSAFMQLNLGKLFWNGYNLINLAPSLKSVPNYPTQVLPSFTIANGVGTVSQSGVQGELSAVVSSEFEVVNYFTKLKIHVTDAYLTDDKTTYSNLSYMAIVLYPLNSSKNIDYSIFSMPILSAGSGHSKPMTLSDTVVECDISSVDILHGIAICILQGGGTNRKINAYVSFDKIWLE